MNHAQSELKQTFALHKLMPLLQLVVAVTCSTINIRTMTGLVDHAGLRPFLEDVEMHHHHIQNAIQISYILACMARLRGRSSPKLRMAVQLRSL